MGRKIENYLTSGLPAKIYLLCYLNPESGYSLGQKICQTKGVPQTSKIYPWIGRLKKEKYLQEVDSRFRARVDPLVNQLDSILEKQDASFEGREKQIVKLLLDSDPFKTMISISNSADQLIERNANVVSIVTATLALYAAAFKAYRVLKEASDYSTESRSDEVVLDALRQILRKDEASFDDMEMPEIKDIAAQINLRFETLKSVLPFSKEYQGYDQSRLTKGIIRKWVSIYVTFPTRLLDKLIRLNENAALFGATFYWSNIAK